ncbi:hypothetical protein ACJJTC_016076 [Scirpophaga incertulas]
MSRAKRLVEAALNCIKTYEFNECNENNLENEIASCIQSSVNQNTAQSDSARPDIIEPSDNDSLTGLNRRHLTPLKNVVIPNSCDDHLSDFSTGSDEVYIPNIISRSSSATVDFDTHFIQETKDLDVNNQPSTSRIQEFINNVTDNSDNLNKKRKVFPPKDNKSKKRPRKCETWKKRAAAIAREKGLEYWSYKNSLMPKKVVKEGVLCHEKCRLACSNKFSIEEREAILKDFYSLDTNSKNALLFRSIVSQQVARQRKNALKHKSATYKYFITNKGVTTEVCKLGLCGLYAIGRQKVDIIKYRIKTGVAAPPPDCRGRHSNRPHKLGDDVKEKIKQHISRFPADQSHYSRNKNMHKLYLSPLLNVTKMHCLYLEMCEEEQLPPRFKITRSTFNKIFVTEFNLSFGYPRSDTCSTCDAGGSTDEHLSNYHAAVQAMVADRKRPAENNSLLYITIDLQQTMPLPKIPTSKAFYLRQIWFYNLGIHVVDGIKEKAYCCTWTEDVADRGSCEVASSLLRFIEVDNTCQNKDHLLIWSDSCAGQNKNFNMIALYQYLIRKHYFKVIDHKFPEVGHSYLDSDRDFGRIEKVLRKHEAVYAPDQYREIICKASRNNIVIDMTDHFRKIDDLQNKLHLINRKKDVNKDKVSFRDGIRWIRVEEYGSYLYKESYDEYTPFKKVDILKKKTLLARILTLNELEENMGRFRPKKKLILRINFHLLSLNTATIMKQYLRKACKSD